MISEVEDYLPYLGQMAGLLLEEDEVLIIDREDMGLACNLFSLPRVVCFLRFFSKVAWLGSGHGCVAFGMVECNGRREDHSSQHSSS